MIWLQLLKPIYNLIVKIIINQTQIRHGQLERVKYFTASDEYKCMQKTRERLVTLQTGSSSQETNPTPPSALQPTDCLLL